MTKRFPSTVRFRLRRHPNRVHLTRSNVIRRNTAAPSPSSPLLSLVLGATLAKSAPPSRVHFSHPRGPRSIQPAACLRCPPSETELRHGRTELASCTMLAVHHAGPDGCFHAPLPRNTCPRGDQQCHPPNRILPFHRLLLDRNFPPSKFSIPQFRNDDDDSTLFHLFLDKESHASIVAQCIYIYMYFLLPPFHLDVIVRGMVRAHRVVTGTSGGLMTTE